MANFPLLKTGAVVQYPVTRKLRFSTQVLRFLDGTEQRFREFPSSVRKWVVHLDLLDETEVADIEDFFLSTQGRLGMFSFTDPWDGVEYPNCSLEDDQFEFSLPDRAKGALTLVIRQNRD